VIVGIELDVADAARRAGLEVGVLVSASSAIGDIGTAIVDQRPALTAVRRLIEPPLGRPGDRPADTAAAHRRHAAQRGCRGGVHHVRMGGVDNDIADALAAQLVLADGAGPGVPSVGRLVDAHSGNATAATDVGLTGADPDRPAGRIRRVDHDSACGVDAERAAEICPLRWRGKRVIGTPYATAGGRHPNTAVSRRAGRGDGDVGRAAAGHVEVRHIVGGVPQLAERIQGLARSHTHPGATRREAHPPFGGCLVERLLGPLLLRDRDGAGRVGALLEGRLSGGSRTLARLASVARECFLESFEVFTQPMVTPCRP
jgi:hypothetical protein